MNTELGQYFGREALNIDQTAFGLENESHEIQVTHILPGMETKWLSAGSSWDY